MIRHIGLIAGLLAALTVAACVHQGSPPPAFGCRTGAWSLADGRIVAITATSDDALRWRTLDGSTARLEGEGEALTATTGWSRDADLTALTFGDCDRGLTRFDGQAATRLTFDIVESRFESGAETLAGRLILPPGAGPVPVMIQVHGSERDSALSHNSFQQLGPAAGVGVFVYDKRGTGGSTGEYTQDFAVLAADAAAAVTEARRLAGARAGRIGLHGASQGGWIAPLAAGLTPVDFVIVSYGLTDSPLAENRAETVQNVADAGFDAEAQRKAGLLADAAGAVVASGFRSGFNELNRLKRAYRDEPWFASAQGEFTGDLARYPSWAVRLIGPSRDTGTTWNYQPEPALRALDTPLLWILAGSDREAPPESTRALLSRLIAENRPVVLAEFPGADHGVILFRQGPDGERIGTGHAPGYFPLLIDYALDRPLNAGAYGNAVLTGASTAPLLPE